MGAIPWGFSHAQGGETMPKKPLRPCSHPGCPNLCEGQFCEQHRVEERRKYDKYERSSDVNRKYGRAFTTSCLFPRVALTQGTTS